MCNRVLLLFGKMPQWGLYVNCHVNGTIFQSGLRCQTGLSSLRVSCKRTLRTLFWECEIFVLVINSLKSLSAGHTKIFFIQTFYVLFILLNYEMFHIFMELIIRKKQNSIQFLQWIKITLVSLSRFFFQILNMNGRLLLHSEKTWWKMSYSETNWFM